MMPKGAVLFSSRAPIGYCAIAANEICTNQGFKSWVCASGIIPEYVRYYLLSSVEYADSLASGTTFREVSGKRVGAMAFPVAPEAEQRRIVAKLDALTTRLARARGELDRVMVLAERLRGPVVSDQIDTLMKRAGSTAPARDLFVWSSGKFLPKKSQRGGEVPVYGGNGVNGWHDEANVQGRTLVVGRVGAHCGNVHLSDGAAWITDNAIYAKRVSPDVDLDLALHVFSNARLVQEAAGTGQPYVNQEVLNRVLLPLETLSRQIEASQRIREALARADRMEAEAARARALLDRLEAAILGRAFRGELVPQDPDDEPASVLLDRIRAQRAAAPKPKRGRRKKVSA